MFLTKVKIGTAVLMCAGLLTALVGGSVVSTGTAQEREAGKRAKAARIAQAAESDEVFLRRISQDLRGREPSLAEIHAYVTSTDSDKRQKVIDLFIQERQQQQGERRLPALQAEQKKVIKLKRDEAPAETTGKKIIRLKKDEASAQKKIIRLKKDEDVQARRMDGKVLKLKTDEGVIKLKLDGKMLMLKQREQDQPKKILIRKDQQGRAAAPAERYFLFKFPEQQAERYFLFTVPEQIRDRKIIIKKK